MCKLPLPMEFAAWEIYSRKFHLTYVLPSQKFHVRITPPLGIPEPECPFPGNFKVNVPSPLEIPRLMYPSPGNLKLVHLSPGNSKVNTPPPLEIPRFLNRGGADNNWNSPFSEIFV